MLPVVTLVGRLTKDPEQKQSKSGNTFTLLSIAVTNRRMEKSSRKIVDETAYFNLIAGGKTGENIVKFCKKGHRLHVQAQISSNQFETKSGDKVSSHNFRVIGVEFLTSKAEAEALTGSDVKSNDGHNFASESSIEDFDDGIPF